MSEYYYGVCCDHIGNTVEIRCHNGARHIGVVDSVDDDMVYLSPLDERDYPPGGYDGPGLFLWGFSGAFAGGFAGGLLGVALGSILFIRPYGYW